MGNSKQHQCKNGGQSKIFKTLTCVIRLALVNQLQKCISKLNALKLNRTCFNPKDLSTLHAILSMSDFLSESENINMIRLE